jgi:hypothetical protein
MTGGRAQAAQNADSIGDKNPRQDQADHAEWGGGIINAWIDCKGDGFFYVCI